MLHAAIPATLGNVLDLQQLVVSRGQLLAHGISDAGIYRQVRAERWQVLLPGVYLTATDSPGIEHRRIAAALFAGEQAQLTGPTVLQWYGFRHAPTTDRVHVLVPHERHRRSAGFAVVQRTLTLDPSPRDAGIYSVTSPARAVVDACRGLRRLNDVRAIVTEAVQARHASATAIDEEIRRAGRSRTALARRALTEVIAGVRSAPEGELRELVQRSNILPEVLWNPHLATLDGRRLPTPDGWLDDVGLALEVDSVRYHAQDDGYAETLDRHNTFARYEVQVLHIRPSQIRTVPWKVLADIEQAYRARLTSGARPLVVATRRLTR